MMALLAVILAATSDPCAPGQPAASPDAAAAAVYRAVGDAERAAGSRETAAVAYRSALALDPSDEAARRGFAGTCRPAGGVKDEFQRGLDLMNAGDLRSAIAAFQEVRAAGPDPSAALVEGICHYELGDHRRAQLLLREAATAPEHRETADLYLGFIALSQGDADGAARLLDAAATSPGLTPLASEMARVARRSGRLVLSVLAESGWDSNAQLAPSEIPLSSSDDGLFGVTATGLYRPTGESGPYLRASGLYRQQARFGDLDYGGASAAAGWQLGSAPRGVLAEYDFDYRVLGGSPFLTAHRLLLGGWLPISTATIGASYSARFESYPPSLYAPFSGTYHRAELTTGLPLGRRGQLVLAYRLGLDAVERSELSWVEHGPAAELRYRIAERLRAGASAALSLRRYDDFDAALGVTRSDAYLDASALMEWDVADHWTLRFSIDGRQAFSNAAGFQYFRIVPVLGLAYVIGM